MLILVAVSVNIIVEDQIINETVDAIDDASVKVVHEEVKTNMLLDRQV